MPRQMMWRSAAAGAIAAFLAGSAAAESLSDAFIGAYRSSGLIEQNRALVRAADEDVAATVAALRPVLNYVARASYSVGLDNDSSFAGLQANTEDYLLGFELEWLLFESGARRYAIDAAKEAVLAAREALRGVEQDVLLRAARAYFNVLRAEEFVDLAQGSEDLIGEELSATRDRFEVGEVTRTDIALAESRLAESTSTVAATRGELARAREEYRSVVGRYPGPLEENPPPPAMVSSLEAAIEISRRRHPSIAQAQRETQVAEINVLRATSAMGPSLSTSVSTLWDKELGDSENTLEFTFGGPIYQGGRLSALVRQARAQRDAQRGALYEVVRGIEQNVGDAWSVLRVTEASIASDREAVQASDIALEGTVEESRLGARTTLDVLDAEQDLLDARVNLVADQIDRQIAIYALWASMGILSVEELNLGIATYDPVDYYNAVRNAPVRNVSPRGQKLDSVLKSLLK